jgi:hypothetical protein
MAPGRQLDSFLVGYYEPTYHSKQNHDGFSTVIEDEPTEVHVIRSEVGRGSNRKIGRGPSSREKKVPCSCEEIFQKRTTIFRGIPYGLWFLFWLAMNFIELFSATALDNAFVSVGAPLRSAI